MRIKIARRIFGGRNKVTQIVSGRLLNNNSSWERTQFTSLIQEIQASKSSKAWDRAHKSVWKVFQVPRKEFNELVLSVKFSNQFIKTIWEGMKINQLKRNLSVDIQIQSWDDQVITMNIFQSPSKVTHLTFIFLISSSRLFRLKHRNSDHVRKSRLFRKKYSLWLLRAHTIKARIITLLNRLFSISLEEKDFIALLRKEKNLCLMKRNRSVKSWRKRNRRKVYLTKHIRKVREKSHHLYRLASWAVYHTSPLKKGLT